MGAVGPMIGAFKPYMKNGSLRDFGVGESEDLNIKKDDRGSEFIELGAILDQRGFIPRKGQMNFSRNEGFGDFCVGDF